jgi:hypothetical protein
LVPAEPVIGMTRTCRFAGSAKSGRPDGATDAAVEGDGAAVGDAAAGVAVLGSVSVQPTAVSRSTMLEAATAQGRITNFCT